MRCFSCLTVEKNLPKMHLHRLSRTIRLPLRVQAAGSLG
jgi:hypothetical protein